MAPAPSPPTQQLVQRSPTAWHGLVQFYARSLSRDDETERPIDGVTIGSAPTPIGAVVVSPAAESAAPPPPKRARRQPGTVFPGEYVGNQLRMWDGSSCEQLTASQCFPLAHAAESQWRGSVGQHAGTWARPHSAFIEDVSWRAGPLHVQPAPFIAGRAVASSASASQVALKNIAAVVAAQAVNAAEWGASDPALADALLPHVRAAAQALLSWPFKLHRRHPAPSCDTEPSPMSSAS